MPVRLYLNRANRTRRRQNRNRAQSAANAGQQSGLVGPELHQPNERDEAARNDTAAGQQPKTERAYWDLAQERQDTDLRRLAPEAYARGAGRRGRK